MLFECPYCSAEFQVAAGHAGRSMTCPRCKGQVEVPKPHKSRRSDEYDLADDDPALSAASAQRGKLTQAEIEALEEVEEPKKKRRRPKMEWGLFLGGFVFPWTPGAVTQWLVIALWAATAGWLGHTAVAMGIDRGLGTANMYQTIVAMLSALGAMLAGVACAGVAAIHGLTILLETTAGNDRMENWPNVGLFLEWIGQLLFVFNAAVVSGLLGLGIDWLLPGVLGTRVMTISLTVFFLFPMFLLCMLETNSPFLPLSGVVFASLGTHALSWLAFYLESACLLAADAAIVYYAGPRLDAWASIPLAALLFSAVVMIYFRLLGRLAFYCSAELEEEEVQE